MTDAFEWHQSEDVAVRTQMAIAVYLNPFGELVIRQEGQFHPDEDTWVVIAPTNVERVIAAMRSAMAGAQVVPISDPVVPAQSGGDLPLLKAAE